MHSFAAHKNIFLPKHVCNLCACVCVRGSLCLNWKRVTKINLFVWHKTSTIYELQNDIRKRGATGCKMAEVESESINGRKEYMKREWLKIVGKNYFPPFFRRPFFYCHLQPLKFAFCNLFFSKTRKKFFFAMTMRAAYKSKISHTLTQKM